MRDKPRRMRGKARRMRGKPRRMRGARDANSSIAAGPAAVYR
jgi:hypothetical protein